MAFGDTGESPISLFELRASVLIAYVFGGNVSRRIQTFFWRFDNQAAVAALVSGVPSPCLGNVLMSLFWSIAIRGRAHWRAEYVNNNADAAINRHGYAPAPMTGVMLQVELPHRVCGCVRFVGRAPMHFTHDTVYKVKRCAR